MSNQGEVMGDSEHEVLARCGFGHNVESLNFDYGVESGYDADR